MLVRRLASADFLRLSLRLRWVAVLSKGDYEVGTTNFVKHFQNIFRVRKVKRNSADYLYRNLPFNHEFVNRRRLFEFLAMACRES